MSGEWRTDDIKGLRAALAGSGEGSEPVSVERLRELGYETAEGDYSVQRLNADARDARLLRVVPETAAG